MPRGFNIDPFQLSVFDGQRDFSGGMNSTADPQYLAANQYAFGKNIEVRKGKATTRRGFKFLAGFKGFVKVGEVSVPTPMLVDSTSPPQAVNFFLHPTFGRVVLVLVDGAISMVKQDGTVVNMTHPTITSRKPALFVNANDKAYLLIGNGETALKYNGTGLTWTTVPDPASPLIGIDKNSTTAIWFQNRLWVKRDGDHLVASDLLDPEVYDLTVNDIQISVGESDDIVQIAAYRNKDIVVFKGESTWIVTGTVGDLLTTPVPGEAEIDLINNHGCIAKNSVVTVGQDIWYLSRRGIETITRNAQDRAAGVDLPISAGIQRQIDKIDIANAGQAQAAIQDNYVLFSVPVNSATNNTMLVYDLIRQAWVAEWTNWNATGFIDVEYGGKVVPAFFNDKGRLNRSLVGFKDNASPVDEQEIQTRIFVQAEPESTKENKEIVVVEEHASARYSMFITGLEDGIEETLVNRKITKNTTEKRQVKISPNYRDEVIIDSPASYWRLGEKQGTIAEDESGNGKPAIYQSSLSLCEAGAIINDEDFSVGFNGAVGHILENNGDLFISTGLGWSLEFWFQWTGDSTGTYQLFRINNATPFISVLIAGAQERLDFTLRDGSGNEIDDVILNNVEKNRWYYVVITYDDNGTAFTYVDGNQTNTLTVAGMGTIGTSDDMFIGLNPDVGVGIFKDYFQGFLDEIATYQSVLSVARIRAHYDAGQAVLQEVQSFEDNDTKLPLSLPFDLNRLTVGRIKKGHTIPRDSGYQLRFTNDRGQFGVKNIILRNIVNAI